MNLKIAALLFMGTGCLAMEMKTDARWNTRMQSEAIATEDLNELQAELARELKPRELTLAEKQEIAARNRKDVMGKARFKAFGAAPEKSAPQREPQVPSTRAPEAPQKSPRTGNPLLSQAKYEPLCGYSEVDLTGEDEDESRLREVLDEELDDDNGCLYSQTIEGVEVAALPAPKPKVVYHAPPREDTFSASMNESSLGNSLGKSSGSKSPRFKLGAKRDNSKTELVQGTVSRQNSRARAVTEQKDIEKPKSPRAVSPRSATLLGAKRIAVSEPQSVAKTILDVDEKAWDRRFRKAYNMALMDCKHKPSGDPEAIYKRFVVLFSKRCRDEITMLEATLTLDDALLKVLGCTSMDDFLTLCDLESLERLQQVLPYTKIEEYIQNQCKDSATDTELAEQNRDFASAFMMFVEQELELSHGFLPEFYKFLIKDVKANGRFV